MTKAIPKIGSRKKVHIGLRRNARFSLRKSARRITKGVIHVQASFNNTIITKVFTFIQCLLCLVNGRSFSSLSCKQSPKIDMS
jgi:hypothetical protein